MIKKLQLIFSTTLSTIYGAVIGLIMSNNAFAVLAQAPLEVSTFVKPNVMIMLDNSGSMRNTLWADGFDPNFVYPKWDKNGANWHPTRTLNLGVYPNCGNRPGNDDKWIRGNEDLGGRSFGPDKCIRVPDPEGRATRYIQNYVNYLMETYANETDLDDGVEPEIPGDTRLFVALDSIATLIDSTPNVRFCLSHFNATEGGRVIASCGADTDDIKEIVNHIPFGLTTPLAETVYELVEYFRGTPGNANSYYNNTDYPEVALANETFVNTTQSGNIISSISNGNPIQYRCQTNFLIPITDGFPILDVDGGTNIPTVDHFQEGLVATNDAPGNFSLPNWDGLNPPELNGTPLLSPFSDGYQVNGNDSLAGNRIFIDDLAQYAFEIDLKRSGTDLAGENFWDIKNFINLEPGDLLQEDFVQQNLITYPVGFSSAYQALEDTAVHGGTSTVFEGVIYQQARNSLELSAALNSAISVVFEHIGSAATTTATTTFLSTGDQVFQVAYNSGDWSGQLLSFEIDNSPTSSTFGELIEPPLWDASKELPAFPNRKIFTIGEDGAGNEVGKTFTWSNLTASQQAYFYSPSETPGVSADDASALEVMNYVLGDQTNELGNIGTDRFRQRNSILSDIIHADPVYVADQDFGYEFNNYSTFLATKLTRDEMVYTGGNDGLLHGFYAPGKDETSPGVFEFPTDGGEERMAFAPKSGFSKFRGFSDVGYQHKYFVDGKPIVVDAWIKLRGGTTDAWRSVLISPLGAGGEGLFALNVTDASKTFFANPANASQIFLWEVTNEFPTDVSDDPIYPDMGHIIDRASIVRVKQQSPTDTDGKWFTITGNGVYSAEEKAVFYAIDMNDETNKLEVVLDQNTAYASNPTNENRNGIIANTAVDIDGDDFVDQVYLTDVRGNIWRLDWNVSTQEFETAFGTATTPEPLFKSTVSQTTDLQNISTAVEVGRFPGNTSALMVYFGTGKYYEEEDNTIVANFPKQSFYGILDNGDNGLITKDDLQEQTFVVDGVEERAVSENDVDFTNGTQKGWYIDLTRNGERVIFESTLIKDRILFTTFIPNSLAATDPCLTGTEGWLIEVDSITGANPPEIVFDTNDDGEFTEADVIVVGQDSFAPAGVKSPGGAPLPPLFIRVEPGDGQDGELAGFASDTEGNITRISNPATISRTSWRRL